MSKAKIITISVAIILIIGLIISTKYFYDKLQVAEAEKNKVLTDFTQLKDDIARSESKYVTPEELKALAKENGIDLKPIERDVKKLDAEIKGLGRLIVKNRGKTIKNIPSTDTEKNPNPIEPSKVICPDGNEIECPTKDEHGYLREQQILALNEPFNNDKKVPWGDVGFSAWRENPWDLTVKERKYSVTSVLSTNEDGRHIVHNKFSIEVDGEKHDIKIDSSKFMQTYPENKFRFDPSLYMGVDAGVYVFRKFGGEVVPNLQLSLFSYGKTKVNPQWQFLGVGAGYAPLRNRAHFVLSPVNYRLFNNTFIKNTYIGPTVGVDLKGEVTIMGGVRVGL